MGFIQQILSSYIVGEGMDFREIQRFYLEAEVMPHRSDYSPDPMGFVISWAGLLLLLLALKVIEGGME